MMSMRRRIEGLSPCEIRNIPGEELLAPASMADFVKAMTKVCKTFSENDLCKYDEWMRQFGAV